MIGVDQWMHNRPWLDSPDADIGAYVGALTSRPSWDLERALHAWRDDGVVIFEQVVDPLEIDALLEDVEHLREHHVEYDLTVELSGRQCHIRDLSGSETQLPGLKFNNIHTISSAAAKLSLTQRVMEFLAHVFRHPPCALQSLTFYRGSQQPIHIDYPYVRCQSPLSHLAASWIPLENIHGDSGPLAYYPGSHRIENSGFFDWGKGSIVLEPDSERQPMELSGYLQERMVRAGIEPRVFAPRKGDVLVWHGNLAHAGTTIRNQELTRKSYVTHYSSLEAYPEAHRKSGTPERGVRYAAHGGFVFEYPWLGDLRQLPSGEGAGCTDKCEIG